VCRVLDAAKPVKSTPMKRQRKSKTLASSSKSKRRKAVADTYSEDEQDYDQLDRHPESEEEDVLPQYDDEPPPKKRRRMVGYEREMEVDEPPLSVFPLTAIPPLSPPRFSPKSRVISVNHASEVEVVV
jgi:Fanconi-associated nuclease 1